MKMEKLLVAKQIFSLLFDDSSDEDSDEEINLKEAQVARNKRKIKQRHRTKNGDSDEEINLKEALVARNKRNMKQRHRAKNGDSDEDPVVVRSHHTPHKKTFVEDVVPTLSAHSFREHFRVCPDVFEIICKDIYPFLFKKYGKGRNPLKLDKQVMIALSYLGNKEGLRAISVRFDASISTTWRIVSCFCDALLKLNSEKKIVKWPNREEAEKTAAHYYSTYKLKGVIGCIDSCHLKIRTPQYAQKAYVNKKGDHSVQLQAVSNEKMEFVFFYAGECGSLDDATLLEKSGLETKINSDTFKIAENQHLLGDSSYPLKPWLITPYQDGVCVKGEHQYFNSVHAECHDDIKRAFGLLKGRFRRLQYIDCLRTDATTKFIAASCILHNICLHNEDYLDEDIEIEVGEDGKECYEETENNTCANLKRDMLLDMLHD